MSAGTRFTALACLCMVLWVALPQAADASRGLPSDSVVSEWPNWPYRTSCEALSFNPNKVFSRQPEAGMGNWGLDRALRRATLLVAVKRSIHGWRLARRVSDRAAFVRGKPGAELESGHELEYMELGRRHGRWRMLSYGQKCWLSTALRGRWADGWWLAPGQPPLGPDTRSVRVISGAHCSRREKPPVLAGAPRFDEFGNKLVMTLWLRQRGGRATEPCEEGLPPWPPIEVDLPEALGSRELFDGAEYPPRSAAVFEEPTVFAL